MKKLFAALLAVLMVFGCVPCITAAETANTLDEFDTAQQGRNCWRSAARCTAAAPEKQKSLRATG